MHIYNKDYPWLERGWMFVCLDKKDGDQFPRIKRDDRMDAVMRRLIDDHSTPPIDVSHFSCKLRGRVNNKEGFSDGDLIETSIVKTIECDDYGEDFIVTTSSGSKYRITHEIYYTMLLDLR